MATSGVDAVTLDPWHEPGIPLDEQYRSWKQRIKAPTTKLEVDAYTRTRMVEQQQQTTINWLHPADQSVLEELDEFDHYLTARWQLSTTLGPVLVRSTIEREPWPLHRAVAHELATDLVAAPGYPPPGEPVVHWPPGVRTRISARRPLRRA